MGQRIQQSVGASVTKYLLDTQPWLFQALTETTGVNVTRYVQGPTGLQQIQQASGAWQQAVTDALGSVRGVVDANNALLDTRLYAPYGESWGMTGTSQTSYGFTGELTDGNGLVYLRARYYNPLMGVFSGIDPEEGAIQQPLALNRYSYVQGNVINRVDPLGLFPQNASEITSNTYEYSCNCGWLDWSHINPEETISLLERLDYAQKNVGLRGGGWGFDVAITVTGKIPKTDVIIPVNLFKDMAIVPDSTLESVDIGTLALSIFMDANEHFEQTQGSGFFSTLDQILQGGKLKRSSFSEEDLVSDLLGSWYGREKYFGRTS